MKNMSIKKCRIFIAICVTTMLCIAAILYNAAPTNSRIPKLYIPVMGGSSSENTNVRLLDSLESDINNTSETIAVYRLKQVDLSQEKKKIQKLFNVSSRDIGTYPEGNTLSDGTTIGIDAKTGRWFYQKPIDFNSTGVLSDANAVRIAKKFIEDNELYPVESLGEAKIGITSTGDATQGTEEILRKNVYYYPHIDGNPVYGTFRICISVSPSGEVIGVDKLANEYELVNISVEGKSFNSVKSALDENDYVLNAEVAPNNISVDSVSDAFYADPESEYIQPIYVFEGTDESTSEEYSIWMDARMN